MEKYAFIDGQFFRDLLSEFSDGVGFDIYDGLNWITVSGFGRRVFWYDSLPARKRNQSEEDYKIEFDNRLADLNAIDSQRGIFVRTGISRYRQRDKRREQKGVDILLAIDALKYAYQEVVDEVAIYTSDLDFYPLFEALQSTKCRGILRCHDNRTSGELKRASDYTSPISLSEALSWCGRGPGQDPRLFPNWALGPANSQEKCFELENSKKGRAAILHSEGDYPFVLEHRNERGEIHHTFARTALLSIELLRNRGFLELPYSSVSKFKRRLA